VRSAYSKLRNEIRVEDEILYDKFWKSKTLPTTQFYGWKDLRDKLPTYENLLKR